MSEPRHGYDFRTIEPKWQAYWDEHRTFKTPNPGEPGFDPTKPKFYVLDMFPYPSGQGLHVGHPEGYTATDIIARYKRMRGFNVLHPMGYDAFGLPAEQYAIEHGVHPAETTRRNIENIRRQIKMFGFSYDWDRELATTDPEYYRWTQWIFRLMFESWYDPRQDRARPIEELIQQLETGRLLVTATGRVVPAQQGTEGDEATPSGANLRRWDALSEAEKRHVLDRHRLAYMDEVPVNWCPGLGTVLANEEVTADGRSERGNYPVYRRPLRQWMLRITAYADRLLRDLDELDWPEPIKLMQRNWIGRSEGADVDFRLADPAAAGLTRSEPGLWCEEPPEDVIRVYTTRPDTLFGATYMVLAPEHPLVERITTPDRRDEVAAYVQQAIHRSERERVAEQKQKTGVFTGAYAINPVNGERIPIWVADYVLMTYGTGAIMAVPAHDERDFEFAKQFDLPIRAVVMPPNAWLHEQIVARGVDRDYAEQRGRGEVAETVMRSATSAAGTLAGITAQDARAVLDGDAGWIKQVARPAYAADPGLFVEAYVGDGVNINSPPDVASTEARHAMPTDVCDINGLKTPEAKKKIVAWLEQHGLGRPAVNYKLRDWIFSRQKYWGEPFPILHGPDGQILSVPEDELPVELPPMEHFQPTPVPEDSDVLPEPPLARAKEWATVERDGKVYRRDLNTMPQWAGSCWYYLRFLSPRNAERFTDERAERYWMPVDLYIGGAEHAVLHLLYARFWHKVLYDLGYVSTPEPFARLFNQGMIRSFAYRDGRGVYVPYKDVEYTDAGPRHKQTGEPLTESVEKMSKSLKNVINPDEVIAAYGADTFRLYEMYMGPLESSKPWNTRDVPGVHRFLHRVWRLIVDESTGELHPAVRDVQPDEDCLRVLHRTIREVQEDIEALRFNTAIAHMIVFVNDMTGRSIRPKSVLESFVLVLAPFAPHIAEELWRRLGHEQSLAYEPWPAFDPDLARDVEVEIAVQVNGKVRSRVKVPAEADEERMRQAAMADEKIRRELEGKTVRRVICVPGRLVNIVVTPAGKA